MDGNRITLASISARSEKYMSVIINDCFCG